MQLLCGDRTLDLSQPAVMGILNLTPDSFSDGGLWLKPADALAHARRMVEQGARLVDVGGESTRPGATAVAEQEELDRVIPVIEQLARQLDGVISIDTMKPVVMAAAIRAGATLVNDVNALRMPGALEVVASGRVAACLMHMQGEPRSMQSAPLYEDVVTEVYAALAQRLAAAIAAGISRQQLVVDPGIGFGKSLAHNLALLGQLDRFQSLGVPLLIGVSRKSMFGKLLGLPVSERLLPSAVAAVLAVQKGAAIVRAHDVAETVIALRTAQAITDAGIPQHAA